MKLFDKEIKCRPTCCAFNGDKSTIENIPEYVSLFVQVTNGCQANCPFCIYHNKSIDDFNVEKFKEVLDELAGHRVKKLNITGGEPCLYTDLYDDVMNAIKDHFVVYEAGFSVITLNTNGINLKHALKYNNIIDWIAISRHHYMDDLNREIFGTDRVPSLTDISELSMFNKSKIQLRCNLISGYIDSLDDMKLYMKSLDNCGFHNFGFVTLAPNNDYCKTHQVDFNKLIKEDKDIITNYTHTRFEDSKEYCKCSNYIYKINGRFNEFYVRNFCHNENIDSTLVYDGHNLRYGFGGEIIY